MIIQIYVSSGGCQPELRIRLRPEAGQWAVPTKALTQSSLVLEYSSTQGHKALLNSTLSGKVHYSRVLTSLGAWVRPGLGGRTLDSGKKNQTRGEDVGILAYLAQVGVWCGKRPQILCW